MRITQTVLHSASTELEIMQPNPSLSLDMRKRLFVSFAQEGAANETKKGAMNCFSRAILLFVLSRDFKKLRTANRSGMLMKKLRGGECMDFA